MRPRRNLLLAPAVPVLLVLVAGCEPMSDPGEPLTPVAVEAAAPAPAAPDAGADEPWADDPGWQDPEPFAMSSEQMMGDDGAADADAPAEAAPAEAAPAEPQAAEPLPVATVGQAPVQPTIQGLETGAGWPLRVVSTVPGAFPPRAILGLPDGREVVVSPGTLLADQGVVVMSVSAGHVQLARVEARGDHAAITPVTLLSQY